VNVPQKKMHARKQSNGPGPVTIGGCAARGLHQPGWSIGVPVLRAYAFVILYYDTKVWKMISSQPAASKKQPPRCPPPTPP
jgi:hypothetical protein